MKDGHRLSDGDYIMGPTIESFLWIQGFRMGTAF